ncbi:MAG: FAD-dependent thymidylate synthase [Planctomycetota bacterium]|nr:FAD-dependent thymidylate synthase [Planctomycetota bacterium]
MSEPTTRATTSSTNGPAASAAPASQQSALAEPKLHAHAAAADACADAVGQHAVSHTMPETPTFDVMGGAARHEIKIHEHGFVALVDVMPRLVPIGQTADSAIVQAARVSYGAGTKMVNEDKGLIRYLLRHRHTTPFEMVEFKFHVCMPIFIARQWIRHRTANVNEYSARYSIIRDRFYTPSLEQVRKQSKSNRQGGEELFNLGDAEDVKTAQDFVDYLSRVEQFYKEYLSLAERGVSRELARIGLPVNMYTEWYWKIDLHNLLRFLALRMDGHAQLEIRQFATAMHDLVKPIVPITMQAWRDYEFEALHLTRLEIDALRAISRGERGDIATENKREKAEWVEKAARLGFSVE